MRYLFFLLIFFLFVSAGKSQQDNWPPCVQVLCEYIRIPSEQYQEKNAGLYLMEQCRLLGMYTEVLIAQDTAFNFTASLYPLSSGKPSIVFLNHIDVVAPGDSFYWRHPPYSGVIEDSIIWGRGAIDNKGMAISQLFAMNAFIDLAKEKDLPYNVVLLCVSGEETDGYTGALPVSRDHLQKINPVVVLGEGGSGTKGLISSDPERMVFGISSAEKTKLTLHLQMDLKSSGHGSVPPREYAMKEMIFALEKLLKMKPKIKYSRISVKAMKELGKHEKGIRGFVQRNFTFLFFRPFVKNQIRRDPMLLSFFANTVTLTNLTIPEADHNQISQQVTATLDCRLMPGNSSKRFINHLDRWINDPRIKIITEFEIPEAEPSEHPIFFRHIEKAINSVYPGAVVVEIIFPATTDNNFFRNKGVPVFGIHPACLSEEELKSVHNFNEHIHIERLESAAKVYIDFLHRMMADGVGKGKGKK